MLQLFQQEMFCFLLGEILIQTSNGIVTPA